MKALIFLSFFYFSVAAFAQSVSHSIKSIDKYPENTANTIYIPSTFSKETLVSEFADQLAGKTIKRIDLVYTRYKSSPSFDQKALNNARTEQFRKNYPGIMDQVTEINWVEQTGATKRNEAAGYFHGFVVFYEEPERSPEEDAFHGNMRDFFHDSGNPEEQFQLTAGRDTTFSTTNGSVIHFSANSVVYRNGRPVQGTYTFTYKEFRNPAEIVLSGIPMTYSRAGTDYNFNSAGMFEIEAKQGNDELYLAEPVTIDFVCNEALPELSFYQLEANTNQWKELHKIDWQQQALDDRNAVFEAGGFQEGKSNKPGLLYRIFHPKWQNNLNRPQKFDASGQNATLLAEGANTGHTYPSQVRGLNCSTFGVFNCDQIYRVGNPITIRPKYIDAATGKKIGNTYVACVIDQNINGSFSFDPSSIMCNASSNNVILLFTHDKKVYALKSDAFAALNLNQKSVDFPMQDITIHAESSTDLKKYLNL